MTMSQLSFAGPSFLREGAATGQWSKYFPLTHVQNIIDDIPIIADKSQKAEVVQSKSLLPANMYAG